MVATKESGWAIKRRLDLEAAVIVRQVEAKLQNEIELADVYRTTPLGISRAIERYKKRRGVKDEQATITPSVSFLHENGQSCWQSWVHAVADVVSDLKAKLAASQDEMETLKEKYEQRIAKLEAKIAEQNSPDEEALMLLLEHIRG